MYSLRPQKVVILALKNCPLKQVVLAQSYTSLGSYSLRPQKLVVLTLKICPVKQVVLHLSYTSLGS
jgi:hypothetical protein